MSCISYKFIVELELDQNQGDFLEILLHKRLYISKSRDTDCLVVFLFVIFSNHWWQLSRLVPYSLSFIIDVLNS